MYTYSFLIFITIPHITSFMIRNKIQNIFCLQTLYLIYFFHKYMLFQELWNHPYWFSFLTSGFIFQFSYNSSWFFYYALIKYMDSIYTLLSPFFKMIPQCHYWTPKTDYRSNSRNYECYKRQSKQFIANQKYKKSDDNP